MKVQELIGVLIVVLVVLQRFNEVPPPKGEPIAGLPTWLGNSLHWFHLRENPGEALFSPPRANTTILKFWLYRIAYALIGLSVYLAIYNIPELAQEVQGIINRVPGSDNLILTNAGPVVLAFLVGVLLPKVPPFKGADSAIRRFLYDRASIPAQQLRERNRFKEAPYEVKEDVLETIRKELETEGFDRSDIYYSQQTPTVQSLWTKASLLMEHMKSWQAKDRYKTAFSVLTEPSGHERTVDKVQNAYGALKGDAKTCFQAMCQEPDQPETVKREADFRVNCKALLILIYNLLSRISLHSHYSDHERAKCMAEIGFRLKPHENGPIPDANEMITLSVILAFVLVLPLSGIPKLGFGGGLTIGCIIYGAVLTPIMIAYWFPRFAMANRRGIPGIDFVAVCGVVAALLGFTIGVIGFSNGNIEEHFRRYTTQAYPWSSLHALIAMLIAWRIRVGTYPDITTLEGLERYKEWGNLRDAAIFTGCVVALMVLFVMPHVAQLRGKDLNMAFAWRPILISAMLAFVLGFLIPTWHRATWQGSEMRKAVPAPNDAS